MQACRIRLDAITITTFGARSGANPLLVRCFLHADLSRVRVNIRRGPYDHRHCAAKSYAAEVTRVLREFQASAHQFEQGGPATESSSVRLVPLKSVALLHLASSREG